MLVTETRINLFDLDQTRMRAFFESIGEKPFRAEQVLKWVGFITRASLILTR